RRLGSQVVVLDAADEDRAGVGTKDARQALHERRLAGAVVADEPKHLAALELKVDPRQSLHRPVGLRDAARFENDAHLTVSRAALAIWSTTIAAMMITPTTICCQKSGTFVRIRPLLMLAMITTPIAVPSTLPTPPNSDVPPITTAAT